jgi:hypothetical protein
MLQRSRFSLNLAERFHHLKVAGCSGAWSWKPTMLVSNTQKSCSWANLFVSKQTAFIEIFDVLKRG